jgi:hypothetical protein
MNWRLLATLHVDRPAMGTLMVMGAFPKGADRYAWRWWSSPPPLSSRVAKRRGRSSTPR